MREPRTRSAWWIRLALAACALLTAAPAGLMQTRGKLLPPVEVVGPQVTDSNPFKPAPQVPTFQKNRLALLLPPVEVISPQTTGSELNPLKPAPQVLSFEKNHTALSVLPKLAGITSRLPPPRFPDQPPRALLAGSAPGAQILDFERGRVWSENVGQILAFPKSAAAYLPAIGTVATTLPAPRFPGDPPRGPHDAPAAGDLTWNRAPLPRELPEPAKPAVPGIPTALTKPSTRSTADADVIDPLLLTPFFLTPAVVRKEMPRFGPVIGLDVPAVPEFSEPPGVLRRQESQLYGPDAPRPPVRHAMWRIDDIWSAPTISPLFWLQARRAWD